MWTDFIAFARTESRLILVGLALLVDNYMPRLVLKRRRISDTHLASICNVKTNYYSSRSSAVCNTLGSKAFYFARASKSCRTLEDISPAKTRKRN